MDFNQIAIYNKNHLNSLYSIGYAHYLGGELGTILYECTIRISVGSEWIFKSLNSIKLGTPFNVKFKECSFLTSIEIRALLNGKVRN